MRKRSTNTLPLPALILTALLGSSISWAGAFDSYLLDPQSGEADLAIMSLVDNNRIQVGSTQLQLNRFQWGSVPAGDDLQPGALVSANAPYTLGSEQSGSEMPVPAQFAGTRFAIPHYRDNHVYHILSPHGDANLQIDTGNGPVDVTVPAGQVLSYDAGSINSIAGTVQSDRPVLILHKGVNNAGSVRYNFPAVPVAEEFYGVATSFLSVAAIEDGTFVQVYLSDGVTRTRTLSAGSLWTVQLTGSNSQGAGPAVRVSATAPVAAIQLGDGDGIEASSMLPPSYLGTRHALAIDTQYVAIACPHAGTTVTLTRTDGSKSSQICDSGPDFPGKALFVTRADEEKIDTGAYLEADKPVFMMHEGLVDEGERNLLGARYQYAVLNPQMDNGDLGVFSLVDGNRIQVGVTELSLDRDAYGVLPAAELQQGALITGSGPFVPTSAVDGTDLPVPVHYAGRTFAVPQYRDQHNYHVLSPYGDATLTIDAGLGAETLSVPRGQVVTFNAGGNNGIAAQIQSDLPVMIAHVGVNGAGKPRDAFALPPAAQELWGVGTGQVLVATAGQTATVTAFLSDGTSASAIVEPGQYWSVPVGVNTLQGQGPAVRLVADQPINALQVGDGDGIESSTFVGREFLGGMTGVAVDSQFVALACTHAATRVTLTDPLGTMQHFACAADGDFPGKLLLGNSSNGVHIAAGTRIETSHPAYFMYEDSNVDDERNLAAFANERAGNILFVMADDVGIEKLESYAIAEGYYVYDEAGEKQVDYSKVAVTPNLTRLAQSGMQFRNTWANPMCSPTRASILTGRYGKRTGVGDIVTETHGNELKLSEYILPEVLARNPRLNYANALVGKWHVQNANNGGPASPNLAGFDHYSGALSNLGTDAADYFDWVKTINGVAEKSAVSGRDYAADPRFADNTDNRYATTNSVNDAIVFIDEQGEQPWFLWLAFHAPHDPWHKPPADLHTRDLPTDQLPAEAPKPHYLASIEALDAELGRLLDSIPEDVMARTTVIFVGDNGADDVVVDDPAADLYDEATFAAKPRKGTLYEGGINVPLIISGATLDQPLCDRIENGVCESDALVNTTDLFATMLDIAGIHAATSLPETYPLDSPDASYAGRVLELDSVSLLPLMQGRASGSLRDYVYAERFGRTFGSKLEGRTVRDARYKLLENQFVILPSTYEFYDLQNDPLEQVNLWTVTLDEEGEAAKQALFGKLLQPQPN